MITGCYGIHKTLAINVADMKMCMIMLQAVVIIKLTISKRTSVQKNELNECMFVYRETCTVINNARNIKPLLF